MLNSFLCDFSCRKDPESKIASLLTEVRRNREMCNQIAQKVLLNPSYMTKWAPVGPAVSIIYNFSRCYCKIVLCWYVDSLACRLRNYAK